jgi:chloramphenicol O-acetyltransferase type A
LASSRENRLPLYYALIYAVTDVANHCVNFRYRIRENKQVVLHERVHPSFTEMSRDSDDDLFKLLTVEVKGNMDVFSGSQETLGGQSAYFNLGPIAGRTGRLPLHHLHPVDLFHPYLAYITLNRMTPYPGFPGENTSGRRKGAAPVFRQVHMLWLTGIMSVNISESCRNI